MRLLSRLRGAGYVTAGSMRNKASLLLSHVSAVSLTLILFHEERIVATIRLRFPQLACNTNAYPFPPLESRSKPVLNNPALGCPRRYIRRLCFG